MLNLIGLRATASLSSIAPWPFAPPRKAPVNLYCIAFGHISTTSTSNSSMAAAEAAPPKGGLLAVHKPMKLPGDERRNSFGPKSAPLLCAGGEIVVCGVPAGFTGWLLRRALAQYSRLVFSVLDGLRAGGHLVGTSGARIAKG